MRYSIPFPLSLFDHLTWSLKRVKSTLYTIVSKLVCVIVRNCNLSVTSHISCIVARCLINVVYLTACCLYQVKMTLHFLSDVINDAESTQNQKYVIIASLKSVQQWVKLINRIPGSRLLISSLPGSALRTHVESLGKPRDVNIRSQSLAW